MSVCGYISTKYGIVYGTDSQTSPGSIFIKPKEKFETYSDGSVLIGVGEVAAFRKLAIELEKHDLEFDAIDYKNLLPSTLDGSIEAIFIRPSGKIYTIDNPHGIYEMRRHSYYINGSGGNYAIGALHTLIGSISGRDLTLQTAEKYLRHALSTACTFDEYCSEPLFVGVMTSHVKKNKRSA